MYNSQPATTRRQCNHEINCAFRTFVKLCKIALHASINQNPLRRLPAAYYAPQTRDGVDELPFAAAAPAPGHPQNEKDADDEARVEEQAAHDEEQRRSVRRGRSEQGAQAAHDAGHWIKHQSPSADLFGFPASRGLIPQRRTAHVP